jgi:hypothetical protein
MGTVRIERCPDCNAMIGEGMLYAHQQREQCLGRVVHRANCEKKPHIGDGYLHGEDDDAPYDVDGVKYCGRCHRHL